VAFAAEAAEIEKTINDKRLADSLLTDTRAMLAGLRGGDADSKSGNKRKGATHGSNGPSAAKAQRRK